ncbi:MULTISPECIES: PduM family microcompartment protein [Lactobacillaceae]|uniref:PduM family microcompartment protein n=1 Tax=Lactobacillaceae TaxID=33958 RepID=UPI0014572486|nr:PduM family microcompartment protein [Lactobacillus sp. HBUAS51381]NLR08997.1 PduM family microcompartment protein [Lactobacillus sp. HBUAS51381]
MDDLLEKVVEKLKKRQTATRVISLPDLPASRDKQLFVDYGNIIIEDVSIPFIKALYTLQTNNAQVLWILNGIKYDVHFYLRVNEQLVNFIPRMMVLDWPIKFVVGRRSLVVSDQASILSRTNLAALPDNATLIRTNRQRLTDEGREICREKNIKIKMRTEENCIWLE